MYINENELRDIVREEMTKTGVSRRIREATAAPAAAAGGQKHTVVKGDTLWAIAKKYYGDPFLWKKIYDANKAVVGANPNLIKPGQVFMIPGKNAPGAPPTPLPPGATPPEGTPPAPGAPKGKQCDLPSYKDSLTTALGKAGVAGLAMSTTIDLIIFGKFYNATSDGLAKISAALRTQGSTTMGALAGFGAKVMTGGLSELAKSVVIGFCDMWSGIISGCTNAKIKFSRTCDFNTFAAEVGRAWSLGIQAMLSEVAGGVKTVLQVIQAGAQALAQIVASIGLAALGLTAAVITGVLTGLVKLIQMGAAAVASLISGAIIAAGKVLSGAGAAVSAVGGGMQAAGGAVQKAGAAMKEGRSRNRLPKNEAMQKFADDLLHASTVNRYLASLDESTRRVIVRAAV